MGFFKHLLELQNRGLRYSVNMNPCKKKICWKVLFVSHSGDVPDSCEREISMNVSVSHLWNKSTDSVKWGGGLGGVSFGNGFILAATYLLEKS